MAVLTSEGLLVLEELELASRGRDRASELIISTRTRLGLDAVQELKRLQERVAQLEAAWPREVTPLP